MVQRGPRVTDASLMDDTVAVGQNPSASARLFQGGLVVGDLVVISAAVATGHLIKFGFSAPLVVESTGTVTVSYLALSIALSLTWWLLLAGFHTYR